MKKKIPIFSIVGKSDSGKTSFIEKLIPELKKLNYKVGTIKHHVHSFEIDIPGKDSWRHSQSGADKVVISSPDKFALYGLVDQEMELDEIADKFLSDVDVIITEGYKSRNEEKIEVFRSEASPEPLCSADELIAIVTDDELNINVPRFRLNDAQGVARFLKKRMVDYNINSKFEN